MRRDELGRGEASQGRAGIDWHEMAPEIDIGMLQMIERRRSRMRPVAKTGVKGERARTDVVYV